LFALLELLWVGEEAEWEQQARLEAEKEQPVRELAVT